MGLQRARLNNEIDARKKEVKEAAATLFLTMDYEDITLKLLSERVSISRPSLYTYYPTKDVLYMEMLKDKYLEWSEKLLKMFPSKKQLSREDFCKKLAKEIWNDDLFIRLLSLHQSAMENKCNYEQVAAFKKDVLPYFMNFHQVLAEQFPNTEEDKLNEFAIQYNIYCNTLDGIKNLPQSQREIMNNLGTFSKIPKGEDIFYKGLLLLSSDL